jgi:hypothetical protein
MCFHDKMLQTKMQAVQHSALNVQHFGLPAFISEDAQAGFALSV